jgi:hypothetical protein
VARAKAIQEELATIESDVDDRKLILCILACLPEEFQMVVRVLETMTSAERPLTIADVQAKLMHVEERVKHKLDNEETAYMGHVKERARREKDGKGVRCYGCGEIGHIRRNCPKEKGPKPPIAL